MPAFTAEQVANAYGMNLAPAANAMQGIGEAYARQQQVAEQRRRQAQSQQLQGLSLISDATSPLEKGTGFSPIDDLHAQRLGQIKANATQLVMSGAEPASIYMQLQNQANGLRAEQGDVTKTIANIDNLTKSAVTKNPYLSPALVRQAMIQKAFYDVDEKGQPILRPKLDGTVDYTDGILNAPPEAQLSLVDPNTLNAAAAEEFPKAFALQEHNSLPGIQDGMEGHYSGKLAPFHGYDPQTGQTFIKSEPILLRNPQAEVDPNAEPLRQAGLSKQFIEQITSRPALQLKLLQETKKIIAENKSIPPEQAAMIAGLKMAETYGTKADASLAFKSDTYDKKRQAAKDAEDSYYKAQAKARGEVALSLNAQRLKISTSKANKEQFQDATDPYNVLTQLLTGDLPKNPAGQALVNAQTVNIPTPFGSIPAVEAHGIKGTASLKDPSTGQPIKAYIFTDPRTNQTGYSTVRFRKATKKEIEGGADSEVQGYVRTAGAQYYFGDKMLKFHTSLAPQLQYPKQKSKDFEEMSESVEDLQGAVQDLAD